MNMLKSTSFALAWSALAMCAHAQLRLEENIDYADGELNAVSADTWRLRSSGLAMVENGAVVVDYTTEATFDGAYQILWPSPASTESVYTSFKLTVTETPGEFVGATFMGVADIDGPDFYRARVFMKRGHTSDTFRLGLSTNASEPISGGERNAYFLNADLQLDQEYLVTTFWDNVNHVARLFIDADTEEDSVVEITGGSSRASGFRRFGILMDSTRDLGRFLIDDIRVGEDWSSVVQSHVEKPAFDVDDTTQPSEEGLYRDPVLLWHYYFPGGWSAWFVNEESEYWGWVWIDYRQGNGSGWIYHEKRGWLYFPIGFTIAHGMWVYSHDLGWIYVTPYSGSDIFWVDQTSEWAHWNS